MTPSSMLASKLYELGINKRCFALGQIVGVADNLAIKTARRKYSEIPIKVDRAVLEPLRLAVQPLRLEEGPQLARHRPSKADAVR